MLVLSLLQVVSLFLCQSCQIHPDMMRSFNACLLVLVVVVLVEAAAKRGRKTPRFDSGEKNDLFSNIFIHC